MPKLRNHRHNWDWSDEACGPDDADSEIGEYGFHFCTEGDFSGYDRAGWDVLNEDDVREWFAESGSPQPTFICGYCGDKFRTRNLAAAIRWFRAHDCNTLEAAEATAIVYDLADFAIRDELHRHAA